MSLSPRRALFVLAVFCAVPLLAACPKKAEPVVDAAPPPPPPVEDVQTILQEMVEDSGPEVDAADARPVYRGPAVNTNVLRLKQCCDALGKEAKRMGSSPEAAMFTQAAAQCAAMAAQAGPSGNAPELGVLRGVLAGRTIPAACAGF